MPVTDDEIKSLVIAIVDTPKAVDLADRIKKVFSRLAEENSGNADLINLRILAPMQAGIRASDAFRVKTQEYASSLIIILIQNLTFAELKATVLLAVGLHKPKAEPQAAAKPGLVM
jgi:hypothetical protein